MKNSLKKLCASLLAAAMVFTYMPVFGLGAVYAEEPAGTTYTVVSPSKIPDQTWTGEVPDLSQVDELASIQVRADGASTPEVLTLTRGTDYTVAADSSKVGPANAVFTTMGSYSADTIKSKSFLIKDPVTVNNTYEATVDESKIVFKNSPFTAEDVAKAVTVIRNDNENISHGTGDGEYTITLSDSNAINAGTQFKVTITVNDEADAAKAKVFDQNVTIQKRDLSTLKLSATTAAVTYDGTAKTPEVTGVSYTGTDVTNGSFTTDDKFTVGEYSDNVEASVINEANPKKSKYAKVEINAAADSKNFKGKGIADFTIAKFDLSSADVRVAATKTAVPYTGKAQTPDVDLKVYVSTAHNAVEIPAANYDAKGVSQTAVGVYSATVTKKDGNTNVTGTKTVENAWQIVEADFKDLTVEQKKDVPAGTDFVANPTSLKDYFEIKMGDAELETSVYDVAVTGGTVNKVGAERKVTITPKSGESVNYVSGSKKEFTYTNVAAEMAAEYYSESQSIVYDGQAKQPKKGLLGDLKVKGSTDSSGILTTADYDAYTWENSTNAGELTATATIRGNGKYEGKTSVVKFSIQPKPVKPTDSASDLGWSVTGITGGTYYKGGEVNGGVVKIGTTTFDPKDYTITAYEFDNNESRLTKVKVTFKGNYKNDTGFDGIYTLDTPVNCTVASLEDAVVTGTIPAGLTWTGTQSDGLIIKKYITVKVGDTEIGSEAYTVSNIAKVTVDKDLGALDSEISFDLVSDGQIIGSKDGNKVTVVKRNIKDLEKAIRVVKPTNSGSKATRDGNIEKTSFYYNGNAWEPGKDSNTASKGDVTIKGSEVVDGEPVDANVGTLELGKDYTLSYENNKNAGTAKVIVTGKGNYEGTAEAEFTIEKHWLHLDEGQNEVKYVVADDVDKEYAPGPVKDNSSKITMTKATGTDFEISADDYEITLVENQKDIIPGNPVYYKVNIKADSKNYVAKADQENSQNIYAYSIIKKTVTSAEVTVPNDKIEVGSTNLDKAKEDVVVKVDGAVVDESMYTLSTEGNASKLSSELEDSDTQPALKVSFNGYYIGTVREPITIVAKVIDIKDVILVAPTAAQSVYSGSGIVPTEKYRGKDPVVKANADKAVYNIVYKDSKGNLTASDGLAAPVNAGKYTATVVATPAYGGETGNSVEYTITPEKLSKSAFEALAKEVVVGNVQYFADATEAPILDDGDSQFEVKSYDKTWDGEAEKGNAVIALKSDANYAYDGDYEVKFVWEKGYIGQFAASDFFEIEDQYYTGQGVCPTTVIPKKGMDLSPEYVEILSYKNNVNISTKTAYAYVKIVVPETDKKYTGEISGLYEDEKDCQVYFNIVPDPASEAAKDKAAADAAAADAEKAAAAVTAAAYKDASVKAVAAAKSELDAAKAELAKAGTPEAVSAASAKVKAAADKLSAAAKAAQKKDASKFAAKKAKKTLKAKKSRKTKIKKAFKVSGAAGTVTYKKVKVNKKKYNKKFTVSKTGKVTVKKGVKKGTYKLTVKVTDSGNGNVLGATKNVVLKIKVK